MFQLSLYDLSNLIFEKKIQSAYFKDFFEGAVGVLNNHKDHCFKIKPSILKIKTCESFEEIFIGYGFAKMEKNILTIQCMPVFFDYVEFCEYAKFLGQYGQECQKIR